ncbi:phage tail protein [Tropicimonas sp. S265A]|uniref:phage tail protein n=1 Tax=Tropicimonas sp. S265A TaxID=3415134 RepID=UPI003C7D515F
MTQFAVNTHRRHPYKTFKFRVMCDNMVIPGVSRVSPLIRSTGVVPVRSGGALSAKIKSPGRTSFEPVTLERGITHDNAFEEWANLVFSLDGDTAISLKEMRKDVRIELLNLAGQIAIAYNIFGAWVSEYQALPELDAEGDELTAIESITLQHEGWVRDFAIREPEEF